jgi:hypothetical protein
MTNYPLLDDTEYSKEYQDSGHSENKPDPKKNIKKGR